MFADAGMYDDKRGMPRLQLPSGHAYIRFREPLDFGTTEQTLFFQSSFIAPEIFIPRIFGEHAACLKT
jgi:hypothetical protein